MHCLPGGLFKGDMSHLNAEFLVSKLSFPLLTYTSHLNAEFLVSKMSFPLLANYTHVFLGCEFFGGQNGEVFEKCAE